MKKQVFITTAASMLIITAVFYACQANKPVAVQSVSLNTNELTLKIGETETLRAKVAPDDAENKKVKWTSDDDEVATVDPGGKVTALKVGTAIITVTTDDGGKTATCNVTVEIEYVALESIALKATTSILVNGAEQLVPIFVPPNATNQNVRWESEDDEIATVDEDGIITGVSVGEVEIYVFTDFPNIQATCVVTVADRPIDVVALSFEEGDALSLPVNDYITLTPVFTPTNATNQSLTWTSSSDAIAEVTQSGQITAIAAGTATITATTFNDIKASIVVTVFIPVESLSFPNPEITLVEEETEDLAAILIIAPPDATNKNVTWESDDDDVATVDEDGVVTAISEGEATITVTSECGEHSATIKVVVISASSFIPVESVALNKSALTLTLGSDESETLEATIEPPTATNKNVTWESNLPAVASVSQTGLVTALAGGTAIITVTTVDGDETATCTVTVIAPVTGVALKEATTITVGKTETLVPTFTPPSATDKNVTWESSDDAVASVDNDGLVTALAKGEAIITVTTQDGGHQATCTVTVVEGEGGGLLNHSNITVYMGTTGAKISVTDKDPDLSISWDVSPAGIIDFAQASGFIRPLSVGTATITATVNGTPSTCDVEVKPADTRTKGANLVLNGDFEVTGGGTSETGNSQNIGQNWTRLEQQWFLDFYDVASTDFNWAAGDPQNTPNGFFANNSNGCAIANFTQAGNANRMRCGQNSTAVYQDINVTAGDYFVSLTFAYRCLNVHQQFGFQTVKILSVNDDGMTAYYELPLIVTSTTDDAESICNNKNGFEVGVVTTVTGVASIPAGVTQIRFLINQFGPMNASNEQTAPIFIFDDAVFQKLD